MASLKARLAITALVALTVSGCEMEVGSALNAQQLPSGGDPEVTTRRLFDLQALQREGIDGASMSPDGNHIAFRYPGTSDPEENVLALQELATGAIRVLTPDSVNYLDAYPTGSGFSEAGFSPNGEWIAFNGASNDEDWVYRLRVIRRDGTGERALLYPFNGPDTPVSWIEGYGWSPDSRAVLAGVWMKDGSSRLELVSVEDGESTVLRSFDWRSPTGARISPDGRHLAFDFAPSETDRSSDIYVMTLDGSREARVTQDSAIKNLVGWSEDGSALYYRVETFESGRSVSAVWRLPMREGRAAGTPTLVRDDLVGAGFIAVNGDRITYAVLDNPASYWTVTVDLESGRVVVPPAVLMPSPALQVGTNRPASPFGWTPDGANLWHFRTPISLRAEWDLVLHPILTGGAERVIPLGIDYRQSHMLLGERTMLVRGSRRGQGVVVQADLLSGEVTVVDDPSLLRLVEDPADPPVRRHPHTLNVQPSPDRSREYFLREDGDADELVARDVASGVERVSRRVEARMAGPFLSPDGARIAFFIVGEPAQPNALLPTELHVMASSGGPSMVVHRGSAGTGSVNWTSDGQTLVFIDNLTPGPSGLRELRKVDADGRNGAALLEWNGMRDPRLHADDRRIVFYQVDGPPIEEVWALENLVESRGDARASASR